MDIHNPDKPLKKQLRAIIETGLDRDYQKGLGIAKRIVAEWEAGSLSTLRPAAFCFCGGL